MSRVEKRVLFESILYGLFNQALSVLAHASLSPSVPHFSRSPGHGCWSYNPQIEWRTNYREMPVSCGNFFSSNLGNNKLVKRRRATIESRRFSRASLCPSAIRRLRRLSHRRRCRQPPRLPGVWIKRCPELLDIPHEVFLVIAAMFSLYKLSPSRIARFQRLAASL